MVGIVLCGGQSSRMGSDKGLLKLETNTWAQTAIDKMAGLNIPVKISVNSNQYPDYEGLFPATDLISDDMTLSLKGPLLGVLSSHLKFPQEDLFVLACDMPLMEPTVLHALHTYYQQEPSFNAYIFTNDGEPEPLCGIYKAKGLSIIYDMLVSGRLNKHSMKFILDHLDTMSISATDEQKKFFKNFNAHAELNGL
ncbi:MAG: molybdenum cofactor guanylyltransferase [Chitinophagaceae bacterium]